MERDAWNKQNGQKRFQGMGFPVKKPNEYACIVLNSSFCTIGWSLFLSVQLSVHNFPTESLIASHGAGWRDHLSHPRCTPRPVGRHQSGPYALHATPLLCKKMTHTRVGIPRPLQCLDVGALISVRATSQLSDRRPQLPARVCSPKL